MTQKRVVQSGAEDDEKRKLERKKKVCEIVDTSYINPYKMKTC
jgi:hypothetical protein